MNDDDHTSSTERRPIRIVLADDTEDVRLLLRVAFSRNAHFQIVGEAKNGLEAIAVVSETRPDVILLDLAMPVMDGMQAIPEIRACSPETEIVVLSGFERSGIEDEALRLGARVYVEKGLPLDQLMATIDAVASPDGEVAPAAPPPAPVDDMHDLLSTLGHELSSPVAVIEGFASVIRRDAARLTTAEIVDFAEAIVRGGRQLQQLIRSFYDARHLASGEFVVEPEAVRIGELVRDAVIDLSPAMGRHPIRLDGEADVTIRADPSRIRDVIDGLVDNAGRFSPPDAQIDVGMRVAGDAVEVVVGDRCGGISPDDRSKLFERFSKIRKGGPGLGLGLYIARGVARAHGGDLTYEPREGGCVFRLRLPVS